MTREYTKSAERMTREELADVLRGGDFRGLGADFGDACKRLADAVRALPVLATCGECGYRSSRLGSEIGAVIRVCTNVYPPRETDYDAAPPSWCRLRGKR